MIKVVVGNITLREEVIVDPHTTTLRQVLEDRGIDYAAGSPTLDGLTLNAGDLDKTFSQFNIASKCFLLVTMKLSNAAKVLMLGGSAVIRSDLKVADVKKIEKYRPDLLTDWEWDAAQDKTIPVFKISVTETGSGDLSPYGAVLSAVGSNTGEGVVTLSIPPEETDRAAWFKEVYGPDILKLVNAEQRLADCMPDVLGSIAKLDGLIEVL